MVVVALVDIVRGEQRYGASRMLLLIGGKVIVTELAFVGRLLRSSRVVHWSEATIWRQVAYVASVEGLSGSCR